MILLFILSILLIHTIFYKPSNMMACGLFGWIGDDREKLNTKAFTILGLFNQSRGTDAVGILSTDEYIRTIDNSRFEKFIELDVSYDLLLSKRTRFLIGHTRNASPGTSKVVDNAQPIAFVNDKKKSGFGLIHNGTIKNTDQLLKKYKIDGVNLSDSYDFAELIYSVKDVPALLKEYIGKAALVWVDMKDPKITYMFRGESKTSEYYDNTTEERPLYYIQPEEGSLYFSSLKESLEVAFNEIEDRVITLPVNILHVFKNGRLINQIKIDRSESIQDDYSYSSGNGNFSSKNKYKGTYNSNNSFLKGKLSINKTDGFITLLNGRYVYNDIPLEGQYAVNIYGRLITDHDKKDWHQFFKPVFYNGYLIRTSKFNDFMKEKDEIKKLLDDKHGTYRGKNLLSEFTVIPVIEPLPTDRVTTAKKNNAFFSDTSFGYPFTDMVAKFSGGDLLMVKRVNIHQYIVYDEGAPLVSSDAKTFIKRTNSLTKVKKDIDLDIKTSIIIDAENKTTAALMIKKQKVNLSQKIPFAYANKDDDENKNLGVKEGLPVDFIEETIDLQMAELDDSIKNILAIMTEAKTSLMLIEEIIDFAGEEGSVKEGEYFDLSAFYSGRLKEYKNRLKYTKNTLSKLI